MELDASENERRQLAYSTQFFDFTPDAFIDSITGQSVDIINEHLEVRLVNIELFVKNFSIFNDCIYFKV